ncbi:MAG: hypothetical protein JWM32_405 [Verrucomicrobia bacterium]|nr:hypothetical protein [Verrucomicrobiota bacterium]
MNVFASIRWVSSSKAVQPVGRALLRRGAILLAVGVAAAGCLQVSAAEIDARHWQLFIDNYAIARGTGLNRIVHHPKAVGVVIDADRPWETHGVAPVHFLRKADGTFVGYYSAHFWVPNTDARSATINDMVYADGAWRTRVPDKRPQDRDQQYVEVGCYATSKDGIHWEKPNLGLLDAPTGVDLAKFPPFPHATGSSKNNNAYSPFHFTDLGEYGNVSDPAKRYAIHVDGKGYFSSQIPDFVHDPDWRSKLVPADGTFSTRWALLNYWDEAHKEWVAIVQNAIPHWLPTREIARFSSPDLKTWTSEIVLTPDPEDPHAPGNYDEPMMLTPFHTEGVVLGLLSWFHGDRTSPDGGPVLEKDSAVMKSRHQGWPWPTTTENPFVWPWARKGVNEMRITISRDGGHTWDRTSSREEWIPHGTEEDAYDRLVITGAPPLRVDDEDWFYLGVFDGDHLVSRVNAQRSPYYRNRVRVGRIALYTQKHDRYVSLSTGSQMETLITKPFVLDGETLQLNVDASRGRVRVGIAEYKPVLTLKNTTYSTDPHLMEQNVLTGFTRDDCHPIEANGIEQVVQFKDGSSLKALQGKNVVLFIELLDSDLYGFRVK